MTKNSYLCTKFSKDLQKKNMINRVLLRIKVLHIVYSFYKGEDRNIDLAEREFIKSIDKAYELYFYLLKLIIDVTKFAEAKIETRKNRLNPTKEDLNPNTRFIDNAFVRQLSHNTTLIDFTSDNKISWVNQPEIIKSVYQQIISSEIYEEYMEAEETDYQQDKNIWRKIFKKIILPSTDFEESLQDWDIYWADDLDTIISFVIKTIKKFDKEEGTAQPLLPKFNDVDDFTFAKKLLHNALVNEQEYRDLIDEHTKNWDLDRIAFMDIIIMQIALSELHSFPTIPINVTLNEYIELSKYYSTEKSATFINGVLDNVIKKLKQENKIIKVVKL